MLTEINLALTALVFVAFGLWGLLAPRNMVGSLGIAFTAPSGVTAIRATYGGFLIGSGLLFGLAAWDPRMHGFGLAALGIVVGAILASRLFGMVVDGGRAAIQLTYAGIEIASLIFTGLCLHVDFGWIG
ncbi:MAG: DUF4345 family protein [Rhizomicrobium sp.]